MKSDNIKGFFDKENFGAWVTGHKRQVAVGCIAACLVIAAGGSVIGSSRNNKSMEGQEGAVVTTSAAEDAAAAEKQAVEEANPLEQDAYPEVNELVQKYYEDMSTGDVEGLASVEDQISEEEQNRILRSRDLVEGYQNISCYTKKGLEENSYLVFVYYELKFAQIDTPAPGLSPLYVYTNDEGNLVIFNGEASDELNAYVQKVAQDDDVMALREEVKTKYEEAKATDENLAKQEERYLKIAQESAANEETAEEETSAEETNAEETTEETPEESTEETAQEEAPAESTGSATAQNRETRFKESVRLRAEASTDAEYLGTAYQGEHVTQIESYDNGWSKISYSGKECYCKTEFLE